MQWERRWRLEQEVTPAVSKGHGPLLLTTAPFLLRGVSGIVFALNRVFPQLLPKANSAELVGEQALLPWAAKGREG